MPTNKLEPPEEKLNWMERHMLERWPKWQQLTPEQKARAVEGVIKRRPPKPLEGK